MLKESPLRISHWNAKSHTCSHWCANTCARSSRFWNRTLKTKQTSPTLEDPSQSNNRSLKAESVFDPSLVDRQEPKEPTTHEAWSYIQQFSAQDTMGFVHGDPTQNPNQVRIQRRFKPNIYLRTANPIRSSVLTIILSHNNCLEE